jgi:hypothetical protein
MCNLNLDMGGEVNSQGRRRNPLPSHWQEIKYVNFTKSEIKMLYWNITRYISFITNTVNPN